MGDPSDWLDHLARSQYLMYSPRIKDASDFQVFEEVRELQPCGSCESRQALDSARILYPHLFGRLAINSHG